MKYPCSSFATQNNILFIRTLMILLLSCRISKLDLCFSSVSSSLKAIPLEGHLSFEANEFAAKDYGNLHHSFPLAVLYPKSVSDIANTIKYIWQMGPSSKLTVAARGHGHSINGQSQAEQGIVINMKSLRQKMQVNTGESPYIDVSAGELWINILHESLKYGLAPRSWTDYLHLTVGGTLSNAGISGQAFRYGPQISNVHQLEVITGLYEKLQGSGGVIDKTKVKRNKVMTLVQIIASNYSNSTNERSC